MKLALVVLVKELKDSARDKRSVAMALLFPLLGPAVMFATLQQLARTHEEAVERPITVPVVGAERAPELGRFLGQHNVEVVPPPADPERAVRDGEVDFVLEVPAEHGARLRAGEAAPLRLIVDASRTAAEAKIQRLRLLVRGYGELVGALRLMARGIAPAVADAYALEIHDVATAQSRTGPLVAMLPYFLMMAVFMGGFYIAVDTTAGERERQSLEPLLANPVPRTSVVAGKVGAAAVFAAVGLAVELGGFALLARFSALERIGMALRLEPLVLAAVFALLLPVLLFASALEVTIAARARTFRQAQASMSLVMLLPVGPALFTALVPVKAKLWMMLVPTLGESLLVNRMLRGEAVAPAQLALVVGSELFFATVLLWLTGRAFKSARIVGGR